MGLISFLRNKGREIFGNDEPEETKTVEQVKTQKLRAELQRLGLQVTNLDVDMFGQQVIVRGQVQDTATAERVVLALGNIAGIDSVDNQLEVLNPEPEATYYTVQEGDSLSKISKAHYGDPMQYDKIFQANTPMLEDPDKIYPGQVLRIPQA